MTEFESMLLKAEFYTPDFRASSLLMGFHVSASLTFARHRIVRMVGPQLNLKERYQDNGRYWIGNK